MVQADLSNGWNILWENDPEGEEINGTLSIAPIPFNVEMDNTILKAIATLVVRYPWQS